MLTLELALWHRLDLQILVFFKVMRHDNEEEKKKSMTSFSVPQSSSLPRFPVNYWPIFCLHNHRNPVKVLDEIILV